MPANLTQALLEPIARQRQRSRLHLRMALGWCLAAGVGGILILVHRASGWSLPAGGWVVVAIALIGIVVAIVSTTGNRTTARDVAREIEERHPELNALIQSAVEQEPDPDTGTLNFLQRRVIDRAAAVLQRQDWVRQSRNRLLLTRAANQLGVLVLLAALLPVFRFSPPVSQVLSKQALANLEVLPGDTEIEKGSALVVMAKFPGKGPTEANLVVLPSHGEARRLPMKRNLDDPTFGAQVPNVTDDLVYRVEYPDGKTREFKATVFEYPRLVRADASLKYPAYTGLEPKTIEDTRRINSVQGTELKYALTLNKAVTSARLWSTNGTELPLTSDTSRSNALHLATTLTDSGRYFLTLVDAAGRSNRIPDEISIAVVPNKPPQMKLVSPRGDQRFSPLEEVRFQAEVSDDFGLDRYGLAYSVNGGPAQSIDLGGKAGRFEKKTADHLLRLEDLKVKTDDLVSYYLWAEDTGPDGKPRVTEGDIYFGDIRPLDEIYREGQQGGGGGGGGQQQQGQSPSTKLLELQKDVIAATWNVKRAETGEKPGSTYKDKMEVIHNSQEEALSKAGELSGRLRDARMQLELKKATEAMTQASGHLADASKKPSLKPLPEALGAEQLAYQHLLRLQAREYEVTRGRRGGGGGGGGQRNQQQLDQLDLANQDQRYENERQAQSKQTPEQREDIQVLSRLKDLARRQNDLNERVKELQTELLAAKTEQEKEELRRELKRLQEQQQQLLSDLDELNQRMSTEQNQSRMAEDRQQLEKTRESMRKSAEQLGQQQASSALASGTRAQQNLENVRDDFRKRTSNQFSDEMRELRNSARELTRQEMELQRQFESLNNDDRKSLSDSPLKDTVEKALTQQRDRLTNILQNVRRVSEESEVAEPLLSRQLYDTYRDVQQDQKTRNALPGQLQQIYDSLKQDGASDLENTYQVSQQLVQKGFAPWGQEVEKLAQSRVDKLGSDIQKAAESVLGDDLQALRTAEREMERLNNELSRDVAANTPESQTNEPPNAQAAQPGRQRGQTNQLAQAQSGRQGQRGNQPGNDNQGERNQQGRAQGQSQSPGQGQNSSLAQGQSNQQGQPPSQGQGQGQGQQTQAGNQQGRQGGGQGQGEQAQASNQSGQQGGGGQGGGQGRQSSLIQSARANSQEQRQGGQAGGGGGGGDRQYSLARGGANDGGGGGGRFDAPGIFTGNGYVNWADRLRNVEEMIDDPQLRQQIATIRDRTREVRIDSKRHSQPPQWDLVRSDILKPMQVVRDRIQQEIARRQSPDNMVAIDRDPVPGRYSELVRRYYERLGSE